jgi:dihydroflavonol-4-reductase
LGTFVTGGTGLLGSYVIRRLLDRGEEVRAFYRTQSSIPQDLIEKASLTWVKGDILDVMALDEAIGEQDEVYHCAGLVSFNPSRKRELMHINGEGTANVVNTCLIKNARKLVHVSSVSALGRKRDGMTVKEDSPWSEESINSNYGRSKFQAEMEVWRGITEGLEAVIVNPTIILGVGDWQTGSLAMFRNAWNEFPWYTEGVSGFVYAADVAEAMIQLMKSTVSGQRYIVSAENLTYREVFTKMALAFGKRPPHRKVPDWITGIVWRVEKIKSKIAGQDPLLTKETAETAKLKVYFDNSKLLNELKGFQFQSIQQTIQEVCKEIPQVNHMR